LSDIKEKEHVFPVPEQMEIDPEFSTVHFPNPEEGAGVLDLSEKCARQNNCEIIIANDPDTDRCCLAELQADGKYRQLTGNEIGALLAWFIWHKQPKNKSEQYYMLSSTVSSHILGRMAETEGFHFIETLTGFKWMGNIAYDLMQSNSTNRVLFAFEEAIGYMCNTDILDKDGISAAVQLAQLCLYVYGVRRSNLIAFLRDDIYAKYGYHYNVNSYYLCYEPITIKRIFERIFHYDPKQKQINYPTSFGPYKVTRVRDLTNGFDSSTFDQKPVRERAIQFESFFL
jgi:phosphomannomutase